MPGQMLYKIADLSTVWVEADVYEHDCPSGSASPHPSVARRVSRREVLGRATYIYPTVDEKTRTGKVRFQFANRGGRLKPGMYATVELAGAARWA